MVSWSLDVIRAQAETCNQEICLIIYLKNKLQFVLRRSGKKILRKKLIYILKGIPKGIPKEIKKKKRNT